MGWEEFCPAGGHMSLWECAWVNAWDLEVFVSISCPGGNLGKSVCV